MSIVGGLKEKHILQQCKYLLRVLERQGALAFKRIHVMPVMVKKTGARIITRPNEDMAGMPDLMVFLKGGETLHIELKTDNGKQSEKQKSWQEKLTELGHRYYIVKCTDDLIAILKQHGILTTWGIPLGGKA